MARAKTKTPSPRKYALISVFDKTGVAEFATVLKKTGYDIISTGGTAKILTQQGIPVIPVQEITGNPESFGGRMKTISFEIESGILFDRSNQAHQKEAKILNIQPIDVVVCNLYPFEETIKKRNASLSQATEHIDVGGPTMIRAAAKNFKHVLVVIDPSDYSSLTTLLRQNKVTDKTRRDLAAKAFWHLSFYDSQIASYLGSALFPQEFTLSGRKHLDLRYGENAHQQAALYLTPRSSSVLQHIQKLWGRELSLTNSTDINAGVEAVRLFKEPAAAVIKHNTPCAIALGNTPVEALARAIQSDPESAFGGVIVLNATMDIKCAQIIASFKDARQGNIDIVAVPVIKTNALEFLKKIRKSTGIYTFGTIPLNHNQYNLKWVDGGFVLQTPDTDIEKSFRNWKIVTTKKPTRKQLVQMYVAWKFISRIRSNAVIVVDSLLPMTRGIGSGQTSRVRSTTIALEQAGNHARNAVLASDSFFPFEDSVKRAGQYGIAAIVQQGGSINDHLSIKAANKLGIAMVFTNRRAFWH